MPNKLIYVDQEKIDVTKRALQNFIPFLQSLHTCLQKLGISLTEPEMLKFLHLVKDARSTRDGAPDIMKSANILYGGAAGSTTMSANGYITTAVIDFLKDKLIERAGAPVVGGLTLNREALKSLLELPDLSELDELLTYSNIQKWIEYSSRSGLGKEGVLIELGSNGYYIVGNSDEIISERWSYRTTTAKGDKFLEDLQKICDALNAFDHSYRAISIDMHDALSPIKRLPSGELVPSFEFISAFEKHS